MEIIPIGLPARKPGWPFKRLSRLSKTILCAEAGCDLCRMDKASRAYCYSSKLVFKKMKQDGWIRTPDHPDGLKFHPRMVPMTNRKRLGIIDDCPEGRWLI